MNIKKACIKTNYIIYSLTIIFGFVLLNVFLTVEPILNSKILISDSNPFSLRDDWYSLFLLLLIFPITTIISFKVYIFFKTLGLKDFQLFNIIIIIISIIISIVLQYNTFYIEKIGQSWQNYYLTENDINYSYTWSGFYFIFINIIFSFLGIYNIILLFIQNIYVISFNHTYNRTIKEFKQYFKNKYNFFINIARNLYILFLLFYISLKTLGFLSIVKFFKAIPFNPPKIGIATWIGLLFVTLLYFGYLITIKKIYDFKVSKIKKMDTDIKEELTIRLFRHIGDYLGILSLVFALIIIIFPEMTKELIDFIKTIF